jgi:pyrroline-5-carboxylate reductase
VSVPETFGVVGLGRMAQALLSPLLDEGLLPRSVIRASVASEVSAAAARERLRCAVTTSSDAAWSASVVLLAIKPQQLAAMGQSLADRGPAPPQAGFLGPRPLLISVLAGVTLQRLEATFPGWACIRVVPNTPVLVRQGLTALACAAAVSAEQTAWVVELFRRVGEVHPLPEGQLDAFLALTSSGPAFAALISEALADGGVAAGLPRALALPLAQKMLSGSMALLDQQGLHPAELKDLVASPAGTTIAGLRVLEHAGLRSALIEAVVAAAERSRALS